MRLTIPSEVIEAERKLAQGQDSFHWRRIFYGAVHIDIEGQTYEVIGNALSFSSDLIQALELILFDGNQKSHASTLDSVTMVGLSVVDQAVLRLSLSDSFSDLFDSDVFFDDQILSMTKKLYDFHADLCDVAYSVYPEIVKVDDFVKHCPLAGRIMRYKSI